MISGDARRDDTPTVSSGEELMTVAQIAEVLKLNQQTIRNWIDQGTLPAIRIGRRVRIKRSDFQALVDGSTSTPAPDAYTAERFWDGEPHPPPAVV
jgi:excisionase family DNA binding protein